MTRQMVVGVDLARRSDYAAAVHIASDERQRWRVVRAEQIPHSADYSTLAGYIAAMAGQGHAVAVDATGVGAPVVEDARGRTDAPVWGVTIHGGRVARRIREHDLSLPKRGLIAHARQMLDTGSMVIPPVPGSSLLVSQLAQIAPVRRSGRRPALEALRGHDDVAFAWMVGAWMTQ